MVLNTRMIGYYRKEWSRKQRVKALTRYLAGYHILIFLFDIWSNNNLRSTRARNKDCKLRAVDETPSQFFKRLRTILWSIVWKDAERSRNSSTEERPAPSETKISFWTRRRAVTRMKFTIADRKFDIRLWEERCDKRRSAITRSVSFHRNEKFEMRRQFFKSF